MTDYKPGSIYTFHVVGIREDNDKKYIYLSDGVRDTYRVQPFDYQLEWEPYNLPARLRCYVVSVNIWGLPLLAQVRADVLNHNYPTVGGIHSFKVIAIKSDLQTSKTYLDLNDPHGIKHRYYPGKGEKIKEVGDDFFLEVQKIEEREKNKAFLILKDISEESIETVPEFVPDPRKESDFGLEGEQIEFKSSIVFPAGLTVPDIDQQLVFINKTIAGFMNKEGGELFLGVNDSGRVSGISYDLPHLNSSKVDSYTYQLNKDGYENKVRNSVKNLLGATANGNISFEFKSDDNKSYCLVKIKPVLKPVFLNQTKVFQRAGNMTQLLKGDEIIWFIEDRYRLRTQTEGTKSVKIKHENAEDQVEQLGTVSESPAQIIESLPGLPSLKTQEERIWYVISFYKDGTWAFNTTKDESKDCIYHVSIPVRLKKERLIMAYTNGCVNVVIPYDIIQPKGVNGRKLKNKGQKYKNGWNTSSQIMKLFCIESSNLLVFFSKQTDGTSWVKIHNVKAIGLRESINSAGNVLINPKLEAKIESIHPISIAHYPFISSLILRDNQTSGYLGFKQNDKTYSKVLQVLNKLLEE